ASCFAISLRSERAGLPLTDVSGDVRRRRRGMWRRGGRGRRPGVPGRGTGPALGAAGFAAIRGAPVIVGPGARGAFENVGPLTRGAFGGELERAPGSVGRGLSTSGPRPCGVPTAGRASMRAGALAPRGRAVEGRANSCARLTLTAAAPPTRGICSALYPKRAGGGPTRPPSTRYGRIRPPMAIALGPTITRAPTRGANTSPRGTYAHRGP